jgi:heme/copper-type cytochrome/quinol oxidase subunit 2
MTIYFMIAVVVVAITTGYSIYLVYQNKAKLSSAPGIIIGMSIAAMTALLTGYLIGIYTGDMFLSTGVSMIIGFIVGFLAGQPTGIMAILGGALAGLISGLIGTIVGIMLQFTSPAIMLCVLLALYAIVLGLSILFILVETNDKLAIDTRGISPFAILAAGGVILALFLFLYSSDLVKIPGNPAAAATQTQAQTPINQTTTNTEIDVTKESAPTIKMEVTQSGYTPNVIRVKKGIPVKLEIHNPLENSCLSTFSMPDFHLNNVNLKLGTTILSFTPDKTGEYSFSCGMQMFKGKIIVQ